MRFCPAGLARCTTSGAQSSGNMGLIAVELTGMLLARFGFLPDPASLLAGLDFDIGRATVTEGPAHLLAAVWCCGA